MDEGQGLEKMLTPTQAACVPRAFNTGTIWPPLDCEDPDLRQSRFELTFGHTALQTRVESIAGEKGQKIWLAFELVVLLIVIVQSLKSRNASHRVSGARVDMVDIVEMEDAEVRWSVLVAFCDCEAFVGVGRHVGSEDTIDGFEFPTVSFDFLLILGSTRMDELRCKCEHQHSRKRQSSSQP